MTGGQSVVITDAFEREGLDVPLLTDASYEKLAVVLQHHRRLLPQPARRRRHDRHGLRAPATSRSCFDILDEDENIDAVAMEVSGTFIARRMRQNPAMLDALRGDAGRATESVAEAVPRHRPPRAPGGRHAARSATRLLERGVAAFTSFQAAAQALRRAIGYWRFREGMD